ncbi:MAG: zinc ribbon domain-containing protein, partial [Blastocatellia bacterium]
MFCPNCAASIDGVKFCRSCGADVTQVGLAMQGGLARTDTQRISPVNTGGQTEPPTRWDQRQARRHAYAHAEMAGLPGGIQKIMMGAGFIFVSLAALFWAPAGRVYWFWLLIPAFMFLGRGLAQIAQAVMTKQEPAANPPNAMPQTYAPAPDTGALLSSRQPPAAETSLPGSITEGT